MKTKLEMIKEMFFDATKETRTTENYPIGMRIIETISKYFCKDKIRRFYGKYLFKGVSGKYVIYNLLLELSIFTKTIGKELDTLYRKNF